MCVCSVMSDSVTPWTPARLLCPWDFPGKNPEVGYHSLLQGLFLAREGTSLASPALTAEFFTIEPPVKSCIFTIVSSLVSQT